jgi:hypothetical protein
MSETAEGMAFRRLSTRYFRAALFYFVFGLSLGAGMMYFGNDNFQFLHSHMLLVGAGAFAAFGAGYAWIASMAGEGPLQGVTPALAGLQFWTANAGLPGMLLGSVLPVGLGLDRIGVLFGMVEAAAGALFALLLSRALKAAAARRAGTPGNRTLHPR